MPHPSLLLLLVLSLVCRPVAAGPADGERQERFRPNIVVFVADDMSWDDCGAYGHPTIHTPHLDRIAREGLRADRAYLTCSSCSPSRASILTGQYPHSTGAGELHLPLPADRTLVSTPLREVGYYTAAVGKWHLGQPAKQQFDLVKEGGGPGGEGDWLTVLRNRPRSQPFFLWLAAFDPHRGYQPGAFDPPHDPDEVVVPPIFPDTPPVRRDLALYYDEIARFDKSVGEVLAALEAEGSLDTTLILVLSDNGRPFPRCKTTVYEDGVRTPFLVRYPPLVPGGSVSQSVISSVDIAATLLDIAGARPLAATQGRSMVPVLRDPSASYRDYAFSEHNWHDYRAFERAITDGRYRLVRNWLTELPATPPADAVRSPTYGEMQRLEADGGLTPSQRLVFQTPREEFELYDIESDPNCLNNLAAEPALRAVRERLASALDEWQRTTDDLFPGTDELTPDGFDRTTGERLPGVAAPHPRLAAPRR